MKRENINKAMEYQAALNSIEYELKEISLPNYSTLKIHKASMPELFELAKVEYIKKLQEFRVIYEKQIEELA